jgi:energy-coupling factor transport system ATP-binding protein
MIDHASALIMNQNIVLFDESSPNLDYGNVMMLDRIIERLKVDGLTVFVADHRFYYLNDIIDKVFFMENEELTVYNSE